MMMYGVTSTNSSVPCVAAFFPVVVEIILAYLYKNVCSISCAAFCPKIFLYGTFVPLVTGLFHDMYWDWYDINVFQFFT